MVMKLLSFFLLSHLSFAADERLTIERLFSSPELAGQVPRGLKFSGDGTRLMFLSPKKEDYEVMDLFEYELKTAEPRQVLDSARLNSKSLSEVEKARLERMRISHQGITEYFLSQDGNQILIPSGGELVLLANQKTTRLSVGKGAPVDVKFSPKNNFISYVRNQNLFIRRQSSNTEVAVTSQGKGAISFGTAEFVAQEELERFSGYWWSDDEAYLAFTRIDESSVKLVSRYEVDADSVKVHEERYPEAGSPNAQVKLGIVRVSDVLKGGAKIAWVPLDITKDIYLARVDWTPKHKLVYQVQSRDQKTLILYEFDPKTQKRRELLKETDQYWVNLNDDLKFLKTSEQFVWTSERTGYKHIYLYDANGKLIRPLTQGDWDVDSVQGIDERNGWVYFTGALQSPLEMNLYRVSVGSAAQPELISKEEGWHSISMNKSASYYLDSYSTPSDPPRVSLHRSSGEKVAELSDNQVKPGHPLFPYRNTLSKPEFYSFTGPSGEQIYYKLIKPAAFNPDKKYPLIVHSYGGPTSQVVTKKWKDPWDQILADRGFVVASFDNRGNIRRGRRFANGIFKSMGRVEVEDHVAGVRHLVSKGFIDENRVGFYGWSYGGYLSLMLAAKAGNVFRANVAIAPVTDFSLYDTHYTERYLGQPQDGPEVYKQANVLENLGGIKGRVLIIHGMADDNVLFTNSTLLFKKFQQEGILYESLTYPGSKHGITGKLNQTHVLKSIADFFERHLK